MEFQNQLPKMKQGDLQKAKDGERNPIPVVVAYELREKPSRRNRNWVEHFFHAVVPYLQISTQGNMRSRRSPSLRGSVFPILLASLLFIRAGGALALGAQDVVRVRYGYFDYARPHHAACARGWMSLARNVAEDLPAYEVECFPQIAGVVVASRLDNAHLDIASLGSTPWAQAVARGIDLKEVYISHDMGSNQAIYVRKDNEETGYVGIQSPRDLINRTIAAPFGSTTHNQVSFLIELFGLQGKTQLVNLSPSEIVQAWKDPNHVPFIDGAACWGSAREYLLENEGRELISAGLLSHWGSRTSAIIAARRVFADEHPYFMKHLVGILSRLNDSFLDRFGGKDAQNAARWNVQENNSVNLVASMVDSLMIEGKTPGNPNDDILIAERGNLDLFVQHTASEQLTCDYVGDAIGSCPNPTGEHVSATKTAKFLLQQKIISNLGIMAHSNATCMDPYSFCGGDIIDPTYLALARRGNNVSTPLGPYEEVIYVDNMPEQPVPDAVLSQLEALDNEAGRSPYAANEIGRASVNLTFGHSNCTVDSIISEPSMVNGTFGDGANALPGRSYSGKQHCGWTIHALDGLVEVRVQRLRVWSGDFVRIYSGGAGCPGDKPRTLLAQLSGMYENEDLPDALPPFRSSACIVVEFDTDAIQERGYAVDEEYGDGFEIFYSRDSVPERDCNGKDWDSDGLCLCGGEAWGGDCSHNSFCIGTTRVNITKGTTHKLLSSFHATKEALSSDPDRHFIIGEYEFPYPNDLDCAYELDLREPAFDLARVELYFDLEETFDLLRLQSGSGENTTQYNVVSGRQSSSETFYVPVDEKGMASLHLTTDDKGRRRGFYAEISGVHSSELSFLTPPCEVGRFGSRCESAYCLQRNTFHQSAQGSHRLTSQDQSSFVRAMPWAPDGGCEWEIEPNGDSTGAIRLIFNNLIGIDLEPYPATSAVGDKVIIKSSGDGQGAELFIESCENNDTCDFTWQSGKCINGGCAIRNQVELDINANIHRTSILLVTDRNDGGGNFKGVDFDVHLVQSCPQGTTDCASQGGSCKDGLCICSDFIACNCPCEGSSVTNMTTGIALGVSCAVLLLLVILLLYCHYKKKKTILMQQSIIKSGSLLLKRKEAELDAFHLGTSKYGDAVTFIDSLLQPESPLVDPSEVENLLLVKRCLIRRTDDTMHIPGNLVENDRRSSMRYIMREFAGVKSSRASVGNFKRISTSYAVRPVAGTLICLPEFVSLGVSQQNILFELLSFSNLRQWDFNVFDVSAIDEENTLLFVTWAVICSPYSQFAMAKELRRTNDLNLNDFEGYDFLGLDLNIEIEPLCEYLRAIQRDYKADNPYHNAIHAADVVQTVHSLIQLADVSVFEKEEIFLILVASAIHDVKHPGRNNSFQVNSFSDLALIHNDTAVLENEHSSHSFKLMIQGSSGELDNLNFLRHVTPSKFAEMRKRIVESVLHTDMSKHFATVAKIKCEAAGKSWDEIDRDIRWEVLMYMLHLADISNPAKGDPMFKLWTDRCLQEFFAQGDMERELGLPISPNCDRNKTEKPDSQIGFINFVVKPAYEVLADIIPAVGENILPVIESNLMYWEDQKGREETE
mmetsp:Transcript_2323/g.4941  ORF Transcript_2323/g.4941 Transcript_2323/m.4941 type:complete len:1585 (+) Transcript_2323:305-5059(+)